MSSATGAGGCEQTSAKPTGSLPPAARLETSGLLKPWDGSTGRQTRSWSRKQGLRGHCPSRACDPHSGGLGEGPVQASRGVSQGTSPPQPPLGVGGMRRGVLQRKAQRGADSGTLPASAPRSQHPLFPGDKLVWGEGASGSLHRRGWLMQPGEASQSSPSSVRIMSRTRGASQGDKSLVEKHLDIHPLTDG